MFSIIKSFFKHPLGKKNFIYSIYKFLFFQIFFRLMKGEYLYNWFEDCFFLVSPGETGLTGNLYLGLHEFEDMGFLLHYLNKKDLFVDVGANVGSYTLLAGMIKKSETISFEPIPTTYKKLERNIYLNSSGKKITLLNVGLSNESGVLNFTNFLNTTNKVVDEYHQSSIKVNVDSLDNYNLKPTVIKIDVEGYEEFVLKGAMNTLENKNLRVLIIELNESGIVYGNDDQTIYNFICSFGFNSYQYDPFLRKFKKTNSKTKNNNNTLFLRGEISDFEIRVKESRKYKFNGITF